MDKSLNALCDALKKILWQLKPQNNALSFLILTGKDNQGKTTLLRQSHLEHCTVDSERAADIYYNQHGVIVELGESWLNHSKNLLQYTLKQLNRCHRTLKISGIILCVDINDLLISQPDNGEQALDITETLVRSGAVDIIVIDSVAALVPKSEIEGEMGDQHMGLQARLMSQALRKLTGIVNKSGTTIIFINQLRQKIGVMFGNPETTTGGNALKFYASVRVDVRKGDKIEIGSGDQREIIGNHTKIKIVKNKVAAPFKTAEFDILYNEGISRAGDIIEMGLKYNVIEKSGAFFSYNDLKLGQGKENARLFLKQNPQMMDEITEKIRQAVKAAIPSTTNPINDKEVPAITMETTPITIEHVATSKVKSSRH